MACCCSKWCEEVVHAKKWCIKKHDALKLKCWFRFLLVLALFFFRLSDMGSDVYTTWTHFEGRIDSDGNPVVDETWGYLSAWILLWTWRTVTVITLVELDMHKYIAKFTGWRPEGGQQRHSFKTHRVLMMALPFSALYLNADYEGGCNGVVTASIMAPFYAVWGIWSRDDNVKAWQYAFVVELVACILAFAYPVLLLLYLASIAKDVFGGKDPLALLLIDMVQSVYSSLPQLCLQSYKYIISCLGLDGFPAGCQPAEYVFGFSIAMSTFSIVKGIILFVQDFNKAAPDRGQDGAMFNARSPSTHRERETEEDMDEKEEQKTCTVVTLN